MQFYSILFVVFLAAVFAVYWIIPNSFRWIVLLSSGLVFYASWSPEYVPLFLCTILVSYLSAIAIEGTSSKKTKKCVLILSLLVFLGVLAYFKYSTFLVTTASSVLSLFTINMNPTLKRIIIPVGISFYTFQTVGYLIDVYRGSVKAEHHLGYYAAFISFFPQIVSGPIPRTGQLLPQLKAEHSFNYSQASYGMKLLTWGFFKKLVIADTLAQYTSAVYDYPQNYCGFALALAAFFYSVQIYCDFSGYTDIAIGIAKLFNVDLCVNFRTPYYSQSIKEFWSRWHISLSTWFRDYVYIPLGGNRVSKTRKSLNIMLTFLTSGLWHGADWSFVFWGGIHGFAQIVENLLPNRPKTKQGIKKWVSIIIVFVFCTFAWIFFAANSFEDAMYVIIHMLDNASHPVSYFVLGFRNLGITAGKLLIIVFSLIVLSLVDYLSVKEDFMITIGNKGRVVRYGFYLALILMVLLFRADTQAEFVYFQF